MRDPSFFDHCQGFFIRLGIQDMRCGIQSLDIFPIERADGFKSTESCQKAGTIWATEERNRLVIRILQECFCHVPVK